MFSDCPSQLLLCCRPVGGSALVEPLPIMSNSGIAASEALDGSWSRLLIVFFITFSLSFGCAASADDPNQVWRWFGEHHREQLAS
jgi:hypothetical protein